MRATENVHNYIQNIKVFISLSNSMFDHSLESSFQDDSNEWSQNMGLVVRLKPTQIF